MPDFSIAVLISGGGTTLRNLIEKRDAGLLRVEIRHVISSNPVAGGLVFAEQAGIPSTIVDRRQHTDPDSLSHRIFATCRREKVDLVVLGGFLRRLVIPADFENRVINIHPSLIPAFSGSGFYGHRVHRAVLAAKAKVSGCTVHYVDNEYDHGPIIRQATVTVEPNDTADSLAARVFRAECEVYPEVINQLATEKKSMA